MNPSRDPADLAAAARDFGGIARRMPAFVVRADTVDDIAAAVRFACDHELRVAPRGQGHTTRGQSLVAGGVVVDVRGVRDIAVDAAAGTATVGAGALWSDVLARTLAAGLAPATLTDYLGLTVGGTLSVGGIGGQSFRHGAQTDQIVELVVVTAAGEVVACSRDREAALFDASRGGLGRCGIIAAAVLRLVPAPRDATVAHLVYRDLDAMLAAQARLADDGRVDYLLGSMRPAWTYHLEAVAYADRIDLDGLAHTSSDVTSTTFAAHATRLDALGAQLAGDGALHPWLDVFVPPDTASHVIRDSLALLDADELADGHVMTYPVTTATPLLPAGRSILFDVLPTVRDRDALVRFEARCRQILAVVREAGGAPYPIGYPIGTPDDRPHARLDDACRRFDPDGRFAR
jgi:FAD/FMN-containing dehydrogenase